MERRGLIWLASFFWRIDVEVVIKKLADLKHVEGNTRLHSEKQIVEYIRRIEMCGQVNYDYSRIVTLRFTLYFRWNLYRY